MAGNKSIDNTTDLKFRWGSYAEATDKTLDTNDIYFLYAPDESNAPYGVIKVNGVTFGSRVVDILMDANTGVDSSMIVKRITDSGTISDTKLAMITVEEHQHYNETYTTVHNIVQDGSLLKNVIVNGQPGKVADNIATVKIVASQIEMGGGDTSTVFEKINEAIESAGVTSFDGKTGAIKIDSAENGSNGTVRFATSNDGTLSGTVRGLGTAAYEASTAFANAQETTNKFTDVDASIDRLDGSVSALESDVADLKTEDSSLESAIGALKTEDSSLESAIAALKTKDGQIDASIDRLDTSVSALESAIDGLNASVAPEAGKYIAGFEQEDGQIKNVTKVALPSGTFSVKVGGNNVSTFTDNAGTNAEVNFVGTGIANVTANNGTITVDVPEQDAPNNGKLSLKVGETAAAEFTANQSTATDITFSATGTDLAVSAGTGTITYTLTPSGSVASGNTGLVTGGTVYTAVEAAKSDSSVSMTSADGGDSSTFLKSYTFTQGSTTLGTINIPKDLVVTSGEVVEEGGVKYLRLHIANQSAPVNIPVTDLVDGLYTAGNGINISDVSGNTNTISAKVVTGNGLSVDNEGIKMALASADAAGAMSSADFSKLAGIAAGAQVNVIESISVNGQPASIDSNKAASVTIDATQITMGGSDSSTVAEKIAEAVAAGVTSFGGATGAISLDGTSTSTKGHVVFTMNSSTLQATVDNVAPADVVSSITAHTEHGASHGIDVSVTTTAGQVSAVTVNAPNFSNIYETKTDATSKKTEIDASIDALQAKDVDIDASISALKAKDTEIDSSITGLKAKDVEIDSSISALKAKDVEIDASIAAIKNQLVWHTLE